MVQVRCTKCGLQEWEVANVDGTKNHGIIEKGIRILENLMHRGAIGGDLTTGDGAGILFQIPDTFFKKNCSKLGINLPKKGLYGTAMVFMPRNLELSKKCKHLIKPEYALYTCHSPAY